MPLEMMISLFNKLNSNMFILRDYQSTAKKIALDFFNSKKKNDSAYMVLPVASGKSLIISSIAKDLDSPAIVFQPSKELLQQNLSKLFNFGGTASVYSASMNSKVIGEKLTYATLMSVKDKAHLFKRKGYKYVILDEAHLYPPKSSSMFKTFLKGLGRDIKVLGLTATPIRLKSYMGYSQLNFLHRSRPKSFNRLIHVMQIQDIIQRGYWANLIYLDREIDDKYLKLNSNGSEFSEISVIKTAEVNNVNKRIINELNNSDRKSILVFVDSVESAKKLSAKIENSAYVTGKTPKKERELLVNKFKNMDIRVMFNVSVFTTGFDHPQLDAIILGRATNSLSLYYQMVGRGTRIHGDKKDCLIIDYGKNIQRFVALNDLTIDNIEGYGYGLFSKDRLLTGIPMSYEEIVTKDDLIKKTKNKVTFNTHDTLTFGKYKGQKISTLNDKGYMTWIINNDKFDSQKMLIVKKMMKKRLLEMAT
jgi:DNA repair protein RadD